jgi:hypothetical protein
MVTKGSNGQPVLSATYGGLFWSLTTWDKVVNDSAGRIPLHVTVLSISDIIQEIQCILKSGIITTSKGFGGGTGMKTTGRGQSFGAWILDEDLQRLTDLLTRTGDLLGLAIDGRDHANGWMDHLDGKDLLYFAVINEPSQMLVDLRFLRAPVDKCP